MYLELRIFYWGFSFMQERSFYMNTIFAMPDLNFYCAMNVWYLLPLHGIEQNKETT